MDMNEDDRAGFVLTHIRLGSCAFERWSMPKTHCRNVDGPTSVIRVSLGDDCLASEWPTSSLSRWRAGNANPLARSHPMLSRPGAISRGRRRLEIDIVYCRLVRSTPAKAGVYTQKESPSSMISFENREDGLGELIPLEVEPDGELKLPRAVDVVVVSCRRRTKC